MQPTEKFTFEQLPVAISELLERVRRIEAVLCGEKVALDIQDEMLDIKEASAFLKLAVATIYSKVCRGEIPATKPGRQLYFNKALFEVQFRCKNNQNGIKKPNILANINLLNLLIFSVLIGKSLWKFG